MNHRNDVYVKFWTFLAIMISALGFFLWTGGVGHLYKILADPNKTLIGGFILCVFLLVVLQVHNISLRLFRDHRDLNELDASLRANLGNAEQVLEIPKLLDAWIADKKREKRRSRVARALIELQIRIAVSRTLKAEERINRQNFQENLETELSQDMGAPGDGQLLLMFLGFFGAMLGIFLAFSFGTVPTTVEEIGKYNFFILGNLGLSYISGVLGLGLGTLIFVLMAYNIKTSVNELMTKFNWLMFSTVFSAIRSTIRKTGG